ncbi:MAG: hypothetical protein HHAS10_00240 [Candidatus Altimarinota bacterium]
MNAPTELEKKHEIYAEAAHRLWGRIRKGYSRTYDVLFSLTNSAVWQSPKELSVKWIEKVAPEEWAILKDDPSESLEARSLKDSIRKRSLSMVGGFLYHVVIKEPSLFQRFTTRKLVNTTLANTLSPHDQDRIIAAELMTKFQHWKSLLSLLAQNDIETEERKLISVPKFVPGENGETQCQLIFEGHIDPIEPFPELPVEHGMDVVGMQIQPTMIGVQVSVMSRITLPPELMKRYANVIPTENEGVVRGKILAHLGDIPVYKKKAFGNKSNPNEPEGVWQPNPTY